MRITVALLLCLVIACKNPKVEIVERQKVLKDEMAVQRLRASMSESDISKLNQQKVKVIVDNNQTLRVSFDKSVDSLYALKEVADSNYYLLKSEFDSLEMELKKY